MDSFSGFFSIELRVGFQNKRKHVLFVINRKIVAKTCIFCIAAQKPRTKRMKSPYLCILCQRFKKPCPFLHFSGRLFGKSYRQNIKCRNPFLTNQIGNLRRNYTSFSRTCTCQNQKRTAFMFNSFPLLWIKHRKIGFTGVHL